ncbi:MAG: T9SS type A sorting domain-containing protein [candidate division WOR-3 bacterium]|nr:MAG: T9SS type A sorting domain-containing protein [candidate division WOR-3 bacterium]
MLNLRVLLTALAAWLLPAIPAHAFMWPLEPSDSVQPLGNNWGEYQNYSSRRSGGYFHNGIDIITPSRHNAAVVAVAHGWVKGWGTISADLHWRLAISDSSMGFTGRAPGWLYAHIDPDRPHSLVGDEVYPGDTIGFLVYWTVSGFDHIHFARISDTGATWNRFPDYTWWFIENPLLTLDPSGDLLAPVFEEARPGREFAFCVNNTSSYLEAESLYGPVDIIARVYDKTGYTTGSDTWDKLAPYRIGYMIRRADGQVVVPWTRSFEFSNVIDHANVYVVYQWDNTCKSYGDYGRRVYYFVVTNTDGDSLIESSDAAQSWDTEAVQDADYWVLVRASDHVGNTTTDSMLVHTANGITGIGQRHPLALTGPISLWPNPGPGPTQVSLGLGRQADVRLRVLDVCGRRVAAQDRRMEAGRQRLSLAGLRPGVYLVELRVDNEETYSAKLVKTR